METTTILTWGGILAGGIILFYLIKEWIYVYNKFQYWRNKAERKFSDIDVLMQQRMDMLSALAQVIKKYDIHEYKVLKEVIEARSRWTKDAPLNEKAQLFEKVNSAFLQAQTLFERYPNLKALTLHKSVLGRGNISRMESELKHFRLSYNRVVQKYNERVQRFPRNIVAKVHGFKKLDYLHLGNTVNQSEHRGYDAKKLFDD